MRIGMLGRIGVLLFLIAFVIETQENKAHAQGGSAGSDSGRLGLFGRIAERRAQRAASFAVGVSAYSASGYGSSGSGAGGFGSSGSGYGASSYGGFGSDGGSGFGFGWYGSDGGSQAAPMYLPQMVNTAPIATSISNVATRSGQVCTCNCPDCICNRANKQTTQQNTDGLSAQQITTTETRLVTTMQSVPVQMCNGQTCWTQYVQRPVSRYVQVPVTRTVMVASPRQQQQRELSGPDSKADLPTIQDLESRVLKLESDALNQRARPTKSANPQKQIPTLAPKLVSSVSEDDSIPTSL